MKKSGWKSFRLLQVSVALAILGSPPTLAQSYPAKPVRILVGYGTGGSTDTTARLVGQQLTEQLGKPFLVENRPGATGTIAVDMAVKAAPDGYTLLMIAASDAIVPALRSDLPYNMIRDLAPIALVTSSPFLMIAHPSVKADDVKSLITLARTNPGKLNYSSSGIGSSAHLAGESLNLMAKINIVHVPYKGSAEGAAAVAAGEVQISYPSITGGMALLNAGKVKSIAVTSARRSPLMPNVPTMSETGLPGFDRTGWYGLLSAAGTPRDVINKLNILVGEIVNKPDVKALLFKQGLESERGTPEEFGALIRREIEQNTAIVKSLKMEVK